MNWKIYAAALSKLEGYSSSRLDATASVLVHISARHVVNKRSSALPITWFVGFVFIYIWDVCRSVSLYSVKREADTEQL